MFYEPSEATCNQWEVFNSSKGCIFKDTLNIAQDFAYYFLIEAMSLFVRIDSVFIQYSIV